MYSPSRAEFARPRESLAAPERPVSARRAARLALITVVCVRACVREQNEREPQLRAVSESLAARASELRLQAQTQGETCVSLASRTRAQSQTPAPAAAPSSDHKESALDRQDETACTVDRDREESASSQRNVSSCRRQAKAEWARATSGAAAIGAHWRVLALKPESGGAARGSRQETRGLVTRARVERKRRTLAPRIAVGLARRRSSGSWLLQLALVYRQRGARRTRTGDIRVRVPVPPKLMPQVLVPKARRQRPPKSYS